MGFAIKRPDGSYRAWNRNAQDDVLRAGEVWEERDAMPANLGPLPSPDRTGILKASLDTALAGPALTLDATRAVLTALKAWLG